MSPSFWFAIRLPTLLAIWWRTHLSPGSHRPSPARSPRSIIIYRLDRLGDLVLTTPLFRELKRAYPKARCTVVVQDAFRSLLTTNPNIHEVLVLPHIAAPWLPRQFRKLLSASLFYWKLRNRHFDLAISPRWDTDEDLATCLCVLTNASRRVGYAARTSVAKLRLNRGFDRAFSLCLEPGPVQHEVLRNLAIVSALGAEVKAQTLQIRITDRDRQRVAVWWPSLPAETKVVALGIGARHASRKWPLENYASAISCLLKNFRLQPIILCAPDEQTEARKLAQRIGNRAIVASSSIRESCAVLERCHLFIGNDSGCAHLAAASGCNTIVVSRHPQRGDPNHSNSPVRFAPFARNVTVLQPLYGLPTCSDACESLEPHCITNVPVADVIVAARAILSGSRLPQVKIDEENNGCTAPRMLRLRRWGR